MKIFCPDFLGIPPEQCMWICEGLLGECRIVGIQAEV